AWPLLREKIPFLLACVLCTRLTARALGTTNTLHSIWADIGAKLLRVLENYLFYIGKIFWPASRTILYPLKEVQIPSAILGGIILVGITIIALRLMWKTPWLL